MPLIENEEAARRLARAIASDLSLYNEEKVVEGIQKDSLFDLISEEIEEGRALYKSRVSPGLYQKNFYDRARVDILVKPRGHVKSKLWLASILVSWSLSSRRPKRRGASTSS